MEEEKNKRNEKYLTNRIQFGHHRTLSHVGGRNKKNIECIVVVQYHQLSVNYFENENNLSLTKLSVNLVREDEKKLKILEIIDIDSASRSQNTDFRQKLAEKWKIYQFFCSNFSILI